MPQSPFPWRSSSSSSTSSSSTNWFRGLFFIPTCLALNSFLFILFYISSTSTPNPFPSQIPSHFSDSSSRYVSSLNLSITTLRVAQKVSLPDDNGGPPLPQFQTQPFPPLPSFGKRIHEQAEGVFHDEELFLEDYKEMNKSFKIYVYPHKRSDPFARSLLPENFEPHGNYASESYFKKSLIKSHFITNDPKEADFFFLPFSITGLRNDRRVSVSGIPNFIRDYIFDVSHKYPYWNRTGGADHFYVACHSVGRSAMDKSSEAKSSIVQVVCSSSYFLTGYISHKDAALPQIWPRKEDPSNLASSKRTRLAFFAGAMNSPTRQALVQVWGKDSEIFAYSGRLKTPYADELLRSKFCLHVKGFEVNTARVGDSIFYGCVPVIIANYYDLPFGDILNWKSFSIVVTTSDIPRLKEILKGINDEEYARLQSNVLKVRKHFKWHSSPVDYDTFHMVMYQLWLRRTSVRLPLLD
ncbi:probable glycosyltransferase At5g03795 [Cucumis sativus]|uniref:Exostosin GT47 domain-containing protein n=1 Tax=Cucumis sativus TaxID=3659 RepID=A0A0A0LD73_CUCSA|nr:probable glycosyltransferase At5g03795 [Cucumis sativus]KGN59748.1 hypothetical protein Csa_001809 [Cucumis sativus]